MARVSRVVLTLAFYPRERWAAVPLGQGPDMGTLSSKGCGGGGTFASRGDPVVRLGLIMLEFDSCLLERAGTRAARNETDELDEIVGHSRPRLSEIGKPEESTVALQALSTRTCRSRSDTGGLRKRSTCSARRPLKKWGGESRGRGVGCLNFGGRCDWLASVREVVVVNLALCGRFRSIWSLCWGCQAL